MFYSSSSSPVHSISSLPEGSSSHLLSSLPPLILKQNILLSMHHVH